MSSLYSVEERKTLQADNRALHVRNLELRSQVSDLQTEMSSLRATEAERERLLGAFSTQIDSLEKENDVLRQELREVKAGLAAATRAVKSRDEELSDLSADFGEIHDSYSSKMAELEVMRKKYRAERRARLAAEASLRVALSSLRASSEDAPPEARGPASPASLSPQPPSVAPLPPAHSAVPLPLESPPSPAPVTYPLRKNRLKVGAPESFTVEPDPSPHTDPHHEAVSTTNPDGSGARLRRSRILDNPLHDTAPPPITHAASPPPHHTARDDKGLNSSFGSLYPDACDSSFTTGDEAEAILEALPPRARRLLRQKLNGSARSGRSSGSGRSSNPPTHRTRRILDDNGGGGEQVSPLWTMVAPPTAPPPHVGAGGLAPTASLPSPSRTTTVGVQPELRTAERQRKRRIGGVDETPSSMGHGGGGGGMTQALPSPTTSPSRAPQRHNDGGSSPTPTSPRRARLTTYQYTQDAREAVRLTRIRDGGGHFPPLSPAPALAPSSPSTLIPVGSPLLSSPPSRIPRPSGISSPAGLPAVAQQQTLASPHPHPSPTLITGSPLTSSPLTKSRIPVPIRSSSIKTSTVIEAAPHVPMSITPLPSLPPQAPVEGGGGEEARGGTPSSSPLPPPEPSIETGGTSPAREEEGVSSTKEAVEGTHLVPEAVEQEDGNETPPPPAVEMVSVSSEPHPETINKSPDDEMEPTSGAAEPEEGGEPNAEEAPPPPASEEQGNEGRDASPPSPSPSPLPPPATSVGDEDAGDNNNNVDEKPGVPSVQEDNDDASPESSPPSSSDPPPPLPAAGDAPKEAEAPVEADDDGKEDVPPATPSPATGNDHEGEKGRDDEVQTTMDGVPDEPPTAEVAPSPPSGTSGGSAEGEERGEDDGIVTPTPSPVPVVSEEGAISNGNNNNEGGEDAVAAPPADESAPTDESVPAVDGGGQDQEFSATVKVEALSPAK